MSGGWHEIYPRREAAPQVEIELWGGPRDGEVRAVTVEQLDQPIRFDRLAADPRAISVETAKALGVVPAEVVGEYRQPLGGEDVEALLKLGSRIRFEFTPPAAGGAR